ncbi:Dbl homology domain-containing protein, partial [Mycena filopes]
WRSTISTVTLGAIKDRYGGAEIRRQEAIHTLCVTEEAFVERLTVTIDLFILPLRMQDSKRYIAGVPTDIAKLFDWLEDILNLHMQLLTALRGVREAQNPVVVRVAEVIRESFVKGLEVYQPYLARLVLVADTIARLVGNESSDFGEFVRIQEGVPECRGWSLESLLVDPVTRLGQYPAMFRVSIHSRSSLNIG